MLTDSAKLWRLEAEMLSLVPLEELGGATVTAGVHIPSIMAH